jgi:dTDP-4-amino-4,6-dideoxygalactose transaminase
VHLRSYYRAEYGFEEGAFPAAEEIGRRTISIPFYPLLRDEEIEYVVKSIVAAQAGFRDE